MTDLTALARWLILAGLGLALIGGLIWLIGRSGLPLGQLPGDFRLETDGISCFFPLASMLLISLFLTVLLNLILRWFGK